MKSSLLFVNLIYRRLALLLLLALLVGWHVDAIWPCLFATCLGLLLWHYHHFNQLALWLTNRRLTPPEVKGIWEQVFEGIYQRNKRARKKQKKLQRRIKQFREGTEALDDGAIVTDINYDILWLNKKASTLLGIHANADIGQRLSNLIRAPQFTSYLQQQNFSRPCQITSPIDELVQLEIRFMPYVDKQTLIVVRDVSQLHRINLMRKEFVANVSHELKTPLTVMRGYIEMLQAMPNQGDALTEKSYTAIAQQVDRMQRLTNQLIELSKAEAGKLNHEQQVDLSEMLQSIETEVGYLNQQKRHNISFTIAEHLSLKGNRTELKSACLNLITNAINYTPEYGSIKIALYQEHDQIIFSVKDNGVGIQPQHLARLTERFYRVDDSRNSNTGGTGLGLSIVKHVAAQHQAKLYINSLWGEGSEFRLEFQA